METHIKEISKLLVIHGHEVTVHTSSVAISKEKLSEVGEVDGISIRRYPPRFNRGYYLSYFKPLIPEGDLIVLEGYPSLANDHVRRKYHGEFPIVAFSMGVFIATSGLASFMKSIYDRVFGVKTMSYANRIISLTENEKIWCAERKINTKKIHIIPAGISDNAFDIYDSQIAKKRYKLDKYILFIGRMFHEKAPLHLVEAVARLPDEFKDIGVIFIGPDAGEVQKVNARARELGISEKVVCAGKVSEKEKYELLAGCEHFVLPTKFEAQGIVFIEAAAQKKAVIGTRVGGVPYVISENETGLLYDYGDIETLAKHIKSLLEDPKKAQMMGDKGFDMADREFRWNSIVDKIEKVYQDTILEFKKKNK